MRVYLLHNCLPALEIWLVQELVESGQLSAQARLLITGHSLGGALAVLAAFDIMRAMPDFKAQMYTYGTPYPGNRAFAHEFNELLPDTWHMIHDGVSLPQCWCCVSESIFLQSPMVCQLSGTIYSS